MIRNTILIVFFFSLIANATEKQAESPNDQIRSDIDVLMDAVGRDKATLKILLEKKSQASKDKMPQKLRNKLSEIEKKLTHLYLEYGEHNYALVNQLEDEEAKITQPLFGYSNKEIYYLTKHIRINENSLEDKIKNKISEYETKKDYFDQLSFEDFDRKLKIDITRQNPPQN